MPPRAARHASVDADVPRAVVRLLPIGGDGLDETADGRLVRDGFRQSARYRYAWDMRIVDVPVVPLGGVVVALRAVACSRVQRVSA
eukprot:6214487-Pleurochrysis_carterae.AAC.1